MCGEELGGRWLQQRQSGAGGVVREKRKEVNRSDLFQLRLFCSIWAGVGGNVFAVSI